MAEKMYFKKKEPFIRERVLKSGSHTLEIVIRKYDQTFCRSVLIDDFKTPKIAMMHACSLRDDALKMMKAGYKVGKMPTVGELFEQSFESLPLRVKTVKKHRVFYKNSIEKDGFTCTPIDKITTDDIQRTLNNYAKNHCRDDVARILSIWRRIYKTAIRKNFAVIDRTQGVIVPDSDIEPQERVKSVTDEDLNTFCDTLLSYNVTSRKGKYFCTAVYYAVQIMRYCGLRPAETFALTRSDIDLLNNTISINKAVRSSDSEYTTTGKTKTKKSKRIVPVPQGLRPVLVDCLQWSRNEFILSDYNGNLLSIDSVCDLVLHVSKKANVKFNLYCLRHQFSSDLLREGASIVAVRDLMGHESSDMSLSYAMSTDSDRRTTIENRKFS